MPGDSSGKLLMELCKPQAAIPGSGSGSGVDAGGLNYGVEIVEGSNVHTCAVTRYSKLSSSLSASSGGAGPGGAESAPFADSQPTQPTSPSNLLQMEIDVKGCLADNGKTITSLYVCDH